MSIALVQEILYFFFRFTIWHCFLYINQNQFSVEMCSYIWMSVWQPIEIPEHIIILRTLKVCCLMILAWLCVPLSLHICICILSDSRTNLDSWMNRMLHQSDKVQLMCWHHHLNLAPWIGWLADIVFPTDAVILDVLYILMYRSSFLQKLKSYRVILCTKL